MTGREFQAGDRVRWTSGNGDNVDGHFVCRVSPNGSWAFITVDDVAMFGDALVSVPLASLTHLEAPAAEPVTEPVSAAGSNPTPFDAWKAAP